MLFLLKTLTIPWEKITARFIRILVHSVIPSHLLKEQFTAELIYLHFLHFKSKEKKLIRTELLVWNFLKRQIGKERTKYREHLVI